MVALVDSHSHLDADAFDVDRAAVIERARRAGVTRQILPAVAASNWNALRDLCAAQAGLFPAYGLHPMYLAEHRVDHLDRLDELIRSERPCAVGECGLDFHVEGLDRDAQLRFFNRQLELAREHDLPVIVHARRAFDEVAACFRKLGPLRGVVHSFSGSEQQAEAFWKLGFSLGISGPVTYPRAQRLRGIVARMPLEYLLLETDSPDQPLHGHQGQRNEPALLVEVLRAVAGLRGESEDQIASITSDNARRLFRLPPP